MNEDEEQDKLVYKENAISVNSKPSVSLFGPRSIDGLSMLRSEQTNKKKSAKTFERSRSA